jgi:multidrug efflux pump subunit AcrA (membrane-fusion protein)
MPNIENEHKEPIDIRSEDVQEILSAVPNWMIRYGNMLILGLIIMLLIISWFVKYPDVIAAEAMITTQIPPQKEYARTTGDISAILVNDSDLVHKNQPLAIIENTANFQDVYVLKTIIDTIKVNGTSFDFPMESLPILFLGDIEASYALFENSYIQYKLNSKLQPFSNEALANRYSLSELNSRLNNLIAQRDINKTELDFKLKDLERSKSLFEKGIISSQDYDNKQLEIAQAQRNYKNYETSISQIREAISNAQKNSKGTEINREKEEMILLKNVIQTFNQLKKNIKDWENRFVLKSNIDGKVSFLNVWNENQTVNQGDLVFTIIPYNNSSFIAKLKSPAQNSGKIKIGQRVNIKLESYPETEFGTLQGTISSISLTPNQEGQYLIDVSLPDTLTTSYNKTISFKQEMKGVAEIITEDLRLIERFFYQFKSVLSR